MKTTAAVRERRVAEGVLWCSGGVFVLLDVRAMQRGDEMRAREAGGGRKPGKGRPLRRVRAEVQNGCNGRTRQVQGEITASYDRRENWARGWREEGSGVRLRRRGNAAPSKCRATELSSGEARQANPFLLYRSWTTKPFPLYLCSASVSRGRRPAPFDFAAARFGRGSPSSPQLARLLRLLVFPFVRPVL